ncbi:MAG: signal recognition particle-docking protein FtsY [Oscillospiraceae bacterium]|jgi:fused signal recognition particle receptor|nr:signal recognition particle-docking protein FtsY [Oscillospiraceae bacterium]
MGFFEKLKQGLSKTAKTTTARLGGLFASFTGANEEFYEELEETLILADVGAAAAADAVDALREAARRNGYRSGEDIKNALADILTERISSGEADSAAVRLGTMPSVILVVGVNGVGKTTSIGKLAAMYKSQGKRVLLAAGDTFRAAAAEQLSIWAQRADAEIIMHGEGADPASVVFDGCRAAKARGCDILICDTAGRLHNKSNLMSELAKIGRVIDRELPDADRETLLVLDATTGQNGLLQAKSFKDTAEITGIILTKLDGTAKGGIAVAIASELGVPVKLVGVGEGIDDLIPFDPRTFAEALLQ